MSMQADDLDGIMKGLKKLMQDVGDMHKNQQKMDSNLTGLSVFFVLSIEEIIIPELRKSFNKLETTMEDGAKETPFERVQTSQVVKDYLASRGRDSLSS